jgi:hypothetical protein
MLSAFLGPCFHREAQLKWLEKFLEQNPTIAHETLEIIADNLKKAGWSWGWVSAVDCERRTIWIADADRDSKAFHVCADEKLTASVEFECAIRAKQRV